LPKYCKTRIISESGVFQETCKQLHKSKREQQSADLEDFQVAADVSKHVWHPIVLVGSKIMKVTHESKTWTSDEFDFSQFTDDHVLHITSQQNHLGTWTWYPGDCLSLAGTSVVQFDETDKDIVADGAVKLYTLDRDYEPTFVTLGHCVFKDDTVDVLNNILAEDCTDESTGHVLRADSRIEAIKDFTQEVPRHLWMVPSPSQSGTPEPLNVTSLQHLLPPVTRFTVQIHDGTIRPDCKRQCIEHSEREEIAIGGCQLITSGAERGCYAITTPNLYAGVNTDENADPRSANHVKRINQCAYDQTPKVLDTVSNTP